MFLTKKETIQSLLQQTKTIDRLDAEVLLAHALSSSREFLATRPEATVSRIAANKYNDFVKQREGGVPVAYITGHKEFFGYDFFVTPGTLIPRPETEHMVERAVELINKHQEGQILLVDIGTGSGCIPIAILKEINDPTRVTRTIATDISPDSLVAAKQNAKDHTCNITFKKGNLFEPVAKEAIKHCCDILITANLPYVTAEQYAAETSIHAEPKLALIAADHGLALYKELLNQLPKEIESRTTLLIEIDPAQTELIRAYIRERHPQATIQVIKDLANNDRIVEITL